MSQAGLATAPNSNNSPVYPNNFPVTPFVVGPIGQAGYQTIQSGVNAANAAGGGIVVVQPGTYTENLTLYSGTHIMGLQFADAGGGVNIVGTHIPPTSGGFSIQYVSLSSATYIFNSTSAGSAHLVLANVLVTITNGYTFNLPNWTGKLESFDVNAAVGTNDGYINNTGGSTIAIFECSVGSGTVNTMIVSGFVLTDAVAIYCPVNFITGSSINCYYTTFGNQVTASNNSAGSFLFCVFGPTITAAFTMSSSGDVSLTSSTINSSNNPSVTGTGVGTLSYQDLTFIQNASFAGTLTLLGYAIIPTVNTTQSSGTLSMKSASVNNGSNTGFLECVINGTLSYIPYFHVISP